MIKLNKIVTKMFVKRQMKGENVSIKTGIKQKNDRIQKCK